MPWIIDTDIFIEGERGHAAVLPWLQSADGVATADVVRGEFLIGAHAVADPVLRHRGLQFYSERTAGLPSFSSEPADYNLAAARAGDARRTGKGKPGLVDGLIAAIAPRTGATVTAQNLKDFAAMGVRVRIRCHLSEPERGGSFEKKAAYNRFAAISASSERSPFCSSICAAMGWRWNLLTM